MSQAELSEWFKIAKPGLSVFCLILFWTWESIWPFAVFRKRWGHAGRNAVISVINTLAIALCFATLTVGVATWTEQQQFGLLNWATLSTAWNFFLAILMLDGWIYLWHRANHRFSFLWRFHRVHHSDQQMDVTTATRFHLGEHFFSIFMRLILITLGGISLLHILIYETLVVVFTMFHHANISIGRFDRLTRWFIITPRMHQIHHSRTQSETDSNYGVIFSVWDRLAGTYQMRQGTEKIEFGLDNFNDEQSQTILGMLQTPFKATQISNTVPPTEQQPEIKNKKDSSRF